MKKSVNNENANVKVVNKNAKSKEIIIKLTSLLPNLKKISAELYDRVQYAVKHSEKATLKDLSQLLNEASNLLTTHSKPVETSVKKISKKAKAKKVEEVEEDDGEEEEEEVEVKPKKAKHMTTKQVVVSFPDTIIVDGEEFEVADDVKNMSDLDLTNYEYEFAFYWTKAHLAKHSYFEDMLGKPKSFNDDFDTCQLIYVSDENKVAYALSDATEALYVILPEHFKSVDNIRYCNGVEFQIYRKSLKKSKK